MFHAQQQNKISVFKVAVAVLSVTCAGGLNWAQTLPPGKYTPCVDYFSVGGSRCAEERAQPAGPAPSSVPVIATPTERDPVQEFLDNHGKPPREFAEFYVNPTPDNARRWVEAFRAQQAKAETLAKVWSQVEQSATRQPLSQPNQNLPTFAAAEPVPLLQPRPAPSASVVVPRIGRFATPAEEVSVLVYYFSASCPFCARLKPDLTAVTQANLGKLLFTCVDLTPLSARQAPSPSNRDGLPCDWRLPQPGEVERLQVRQTPTLLISRPGSGGQRLTGVISPAQLQNALFGQP